MVYKIERTIPLGRRLYTVDICYSDSDEVCISALNYDGRYQVDGVKMFSPSGLYIAIKTNNWSTNFIYGTEDSVFRQRTDNNSRYKIWPEGCVQEDSIAFGSLPKEGFSPQGLAFRKSGGFLICLWNNKVGQRSYGKVIVLDGNPNFQIFRDKNTPLYVCPTYIAENGNGDVCVSDVRAVVVTDAGGMLRFRYQGHSSSNNFDPYGICCDSSCNIIVADMKNNKINLIDKDGAFLYHVTYEGMKMPRALCIDEDDNVYVGEWDSDAVKVIKR